MENIVLTTEIKEYPLYTHDELDDIAPLFQGFKYNREIEWAAPPKRPTGLPSGAASRSREPWCRRKRVEAYFSSFQSGTPHAAQGRLNHLFRSQRAARLLRELEARNVLPQ